MRGRRDQGEGHRIAYASIGSGGARWWRRLYPTLELYVMSYTRDRFRGGSVEKFKFEEIAATRVCRKASDNLQGRNSTAP